MLDSVVDDHKRGLLDTCSLSGQHGLRFMLLQSLVVFCADLPAERIRLDTADVTLVPISCFPALNIVVVLTVNVDVLANLVINLKLTSDH